MTEAADDLSAPLGRKTQRVKRRLRLPFTTMQALAVLLGIFLAVFAGFAIFGDNPFGGEPIPHVSITQKDQPDNKLATAPSIFLDRDAKSEPRQAPAGDQRT